MNCTFDKDQFTRLLIYPPDEARKQELEAHLASCYSCREEFATVGKLWGLMAEMPEVEPSQGMQRSFRTMLENFKETVSAEQAQKIPFAEYLKRAFSLHPKFQFAYSLVVLLAGALIALLVFRNGNGENTQIGKLSKQVEEMKQTMTLALLENPSASERMRAVSFIEEKKTVNKEVAAALFTTLNGDENVNVRLSALEALGKLASDASVREGLIQSIMQQPSPIMQSALADVMVKLQEKKSVRPLKQLLQQKNLDTTVKTKIEESIQQLI